MKMTRTPLRVSFFGGGTDYPEYFAEHGGAVLGSAIDKYSYITASPFRSQLFDYKIRVSYRQVELVRDVNDIEHAVVKECLKHCGLEKDIELHNVADLPAYTGLGSSSTFTVGLLQALHAFKGEEVEPIDLAYEAIHLERNVLKENVGCQDQTFAAVGGFNMIEFIRPDDIRVTELNLPHQRLEELEEHFLLIFTGIKRRASEVVKDQLSKVSDNTATLKKMRGMVDRGYEILCGSSDLSAFGQLLHEAWTAKKSLAGNVSNPQIDEMYQRGLDNGALGGKLLGAGGGGFILFFAPPEKHADLRKAFNQYEEVTLGLNAPGAQVVFDPS